MPPTFEHTFDHPGYKGSVSMSTGCYIDGKFVDGVEGKTFETINPTNGKVITTVSEGSAKDVDIAVEAAQRAYDTTWGEHCPPAKRAVILHRLAELMEENIDEIASIESLDNGKAFAFAKGFDVAEAAGCLKYYAGWAGKNSGKVIEVDENKMAYTRHEPIGVVGQIIPWNFPILMFAWKIGPALATGNTIVMKTSEMTPLSALRVCALMKEAGLPDGVFNLVNGFGATVGAAISAHMKILKVAFTGSTLVGRQIMKAAANSNLKTVTLELGGKSPNIVFNDADLAAAVSWGAFGIFFNSGQACCAGSRIMVQEGIYDKYVAAMIEHMKSIKVGDPMDASTFQGPQISQTQYDRIMGYVDSGKNEGATVATGGGRHGSDGYFIEPTVFTDVKPDMKISQEEIFGPVVVISKFTDEADAIKQANNTEYGLASSVFTTDVSRAIRVASKIHAGTVWVNCHNQLNFSVPFGGYKSSGIGRELGEYALANYTAIKSVHINLSNPPPM